MGNSMVIAINMLFFRKENELAFLQRIVEDLIARYPEHSFIILYNNEPPITEFSNTTFFNTGLAPLSIERWNLWLYFKIKKVRKLYHPDILVNNGEAFITPKDLRQIMLYPDLDYAQNPPIHTKRSRRFYQLFSSALFKRQTYIIVVSQVQRNFITRHFTLEASRVKVVITRTDKSELLPGWELKEDIKEKFAGGFEYFLYSGYINTSKNLLNLLKGFSAFKKRQKSSMQLLITGKEGVLFQEFSKTLKLYKYKSAVHVIPFTNIEDHQQLISAAYAMIFCYPFDNNIKDLLASLACEVPAIVPENGTLHEVGRDGVLPYETGNIPDLASKMILLFKDEKYRKKLTENTNSWIGETAADKGVDRIWQTIESAFQN